jgi:hypothetical protein
MNTAIHIECPIEVLMSVHSDSQAFADLMKLQTAIYLFKEHKITSGTAATWLGIDRTLFLFKAMEAGAVLLSNSEDDFQREMSLI